MHFEYCKILVVLNEEINFISNFKIPYLLQLLNKKIQGKELERLMALIHPHQAVMAPMGAGVELEIFPWLRFLPNKTWSLLKWVREESKYLIGKWIDQCRVSRSYKWMREECKLMIGRWIDKG
mgnify:CR=1 FL=1